MASSLNYEPNCYEKNHFDDCRIPFYKRDSGSLWWTLCIYIENAVYKDHITVSDFLDLAEVHELEDRLFLYHDSIATPRDKALHYETSWPW